MTAGFSLASPGMHGGLRGEQACQFDPQFRLQFCRGCRAGLGIDRLRQAYDAIDGRQAGHAKQLAGDAFDGVARDGARRKPFGNDDTQPRMWQLILAGVQHEMRAFLGRAQTKNG